MKLRSVTKLDKRRETKSKQFDNDFMTKIVTPLSFFQFTANFEQSGSRIPEAYLLIVTSYLSKTENRIKKIFNTALTLLLLVKVLFWPKNADFFAKKC